MRQEITRKVGLALQPEEEVLTNRFEAMHSQISAPTQFKGRISEMLSQLRMRQHIDSQNHERYTMDPIAQDDIKTVSKIKILVVLSCFYLYLFVFTVFEYGTARDGSTDRNYKRRFGILEDN